jgi:S-adenosylmethionine:tRNA ribosyltransferase-isomerase
MSDPAALPLSDFDYPLPEASIAQQPCVPRDGCRLAVRNRAADTLSHSLFSRLPEHLRAGDLLVLNDSRVLPGRIPCRKREGGGAVEVLLLRQEPGGAWEALLKPARRVRPGMHLDAVLGSEPAAGFLVLEKLPEGTARLAWQGSRPLDQAAMEQVGLPPLPPYIHRTLGQDSAADREAYQTVFARHPGSAAAPTAGLHFTPGLIQALKDKGCLFTSVTLHVGLGTFLPVKEEDARRHHMHEEWFDIPPSAVQAVNAAKAAGRRVICVGTTALRTLESGDWASGQLAPGQGNTRLFITPGYRFKAADGLITNFHVPRSTLLMLVSAFDRREKVLAAYRECLGLGYRFLSYGDAMLFL